MTALACFLALALCLLAGCGAKESADITSLEQLNEPGRKIGMSNDTNDDILVAEKLPQAEVEYYQDAMAGYLSVSQGKLDAFVYGKLTMDTAIRNGMQGVRLLDETLGESYTMAAAIAPNPTIPDLEDKINAFLDEVKENGTLDDMIDRWLIRKDETMPEIPAAPASSDLHLVVGTSGVYEPFTYYVGTELRGYDIELAYRFASWLGATVEFKVYDYGGIIAAAQSGDVDCIFAALFITPERQEALRFSQPTYVEEIAVMVRDTGTAAQALTAAEYSEYAELSGKKVSMLTGAPFEELVRSKVPDVGEFTFFNNTPDMIQALKSGKTDAFLLNNAVAALAVNRNPELALFPQDLQTGVFGFAFAKDDPRRDDWQAACDSISEETKNALWEKWTGADDSVKLLPEQDWPGSNGTVQAAVCDTLEPMSYMGDGGQLVGFDIEMILLMAKQLDVHVEFTGMEFSAIMSSVQAGKALLGAGSIIATEERKQSVDFVEYYPASFVLVVRSVQTDAGTVRTLADMEQASVGVLSGTLFPEIVGGYLPEAKILIFNSTADEVAALKSGKVDAIALDGPVARNMQAEDDALTVLPELLGSMDFGFVLSKSDAGEALCRELDEYLRGLKADGTLEALQKKWFDSADVSALDTVDYRDLPDTNGTIRLAGTAAYTPFVVRLGALYGGYEVELIAMFCRDRGYALEFFDMSFDAVLSAVQSGRCDIGCDCITITEERRESVLFSEPDYTGGTALLVMQDAPAESAGGFLSSMADSFQKTFIRENRWKLFAEGVGTTLLITVLSIIFGTALGFGVFMLCRNGNLVANTVTRFCVWLVQGMPVVVLLMILYYIIFGKVAISGAAVSVVGFTLVFGAAMYAMLKSGVGAIDRGQTEAAYALGYTDRKAFFRVVLPQALPHFMPAYKGEITALIKATAVVGYVAVQDLTKMGDIVRSRTYEAFFPLIAVAVIYFILAAILTFIVNKIEIRIDPRRRSRDSILKGVDVQ